jgi:hypothetical protein
MHHDSREWIQNDQRHDVPSRASTSSSAGAAALAAAAGAADEAAAGAAAETIKVKQVESVWFQDDDIVHGAR